MGRSARKFAIMALMCVPSLGALAWAGDHVPRKLPANAIPRAGASDEKHITRAQKVMLVRDVVRATTRQVLHHPVSSTVNGLGRFTERLGVRASESIPIGAAPGGQCAEAGGPLTSARITPLFDSAPAYDALLNLIGSATNRVDLMIFGWDDDEAGRRMATALMAKARLGVLVRLMVDRGGYVTGEGNARVGRGERTFLDDLRDEPNVHVIESPDACVRFDHRKVAVVDDRIVWTGGMILTRPALTRWHNFAFLAEGPIVRQYGDLFDARWRELGGCAVARTPSDSAANAPPNAAVRMVRTDVGFRSLKEAVYGAVDSARHHIYLENPYFSDQILVKKLVAARARGVDVRVVTTLCGDVPVMNRYVAITANHLLQGGVRVYLYPKMTHVKAMSVDGTIAYIGTGNFDELSLRNNREVGLTVRGPELIRRIDEALFLRDIAESQELRQLLPPPRGRWLLEAGALWY